MSTTYVILGLLDIKPMSGYDLAQTINTSLTSLWSASYGQIYPTLHKLKDQGLIQDETYADGRRQRIVYSLTARGRAKFESWLETPIRYLPERDPFRLWVFNFERLMPGTVQKALDRHISLYKARVKTLEHIIQDIAEDRDPLVSARASDLNAEQLYQLKQMRIMIFEELAAQARFEVESAARLRERYHELYSRNQKKRAI